MLPLSFKPKYKCELIRIGSKNDGGYLVEKQSFIKSKFLIGVGINDDWKFEKEFNKPFIGIDDQISYINDLKIDDELKNDYVDFFKAEKEALLINKRTFQDREVH